MGLRRGVAFYPAASEDEVVLVEDGGLAGGDAGLRFVEDELGVVGVEGDDLGLDGGGVVAEFGFDGDGLVGRGRGNGEPACAFEGAGCAFEVGLWADDDEVVCGVDVDDVEW